MPNMTWIFAGAVIGLAGLGAFVVWLLGREAEKTGKATERAANSDAVLKAEAKAAAVVATGSTPDATQADIDKGKF